MKFDPILLIPPDRWFNPIDDSMRILSGDSMRMLSLIQSKNYVKLVCRTNIDTTSNPIGSIWRWFYPIDSIWWFHPTMRLIVCSIPLHQSMLSIQSNDAMFVRSIRRSVLLILIWSNPIIRLIPSKIISLLKMFYKDALARSYRWQFRTRCSDRPIRSIHVSISSNRCCQVSNCIDASISLIDSSIRSVIQSHWFHPIDDSIRILSVIRSDDSIRLMISSMRYSIDSFYRSHTIQSIPSHLITRWSDQSIQSVHLSIASWPMIPFNRWFIKSMLLLMSLGASNRYECSPSFTISSRLNFYRFI